jgi:nucleotide-binding universal stress UspA family protein
MAENTTAQPIVAGVDGSASALNAAVWAADEAARRHLPLRLVYAVDLSPLAYSGGFRPSPNYANHVEAEGRNALGEAAAAVELPHPDLDVTTVLRGSSSVQTLIDESDNARLVVLGSRGLGGFAGLLAGSNAVALVSHGRCPVAIIRGGQPAVDGPVVVGVDGSPNSEAAVEIAFEEASLRGVGLTAVHTWVQFASDSAYAYARQFATSMDDVQASETELLAASLAGWQEKYPNVTVARVVMRDRPARCLIDHAAGAQLLVVGSRGHGGFTGMLLGSTSQALIYHAPCPLLVARSAKS